MSHHSMRVGIFVQRGCLYVGSYGLEYINFIFLFLIKIYYFKINYQWRKVIWHHNTIIYYQF